MNKKNKVLISAAGMLILTATAATASTFAWFTTVRTATINYTEASVRTDGGDLQISYLTSLNNGWTTNTLDPDTNTLTLGGSNFVTDISGDGMDFYRPVWATNDTSSTTATSFDHITTTTVGDADGYYIDFSVTVSRSNLADDAGMKVYLDAGTGFVASTSGDPVKNARAVASARLGVLDFTTNTTKIIYTSEPDTQAQTADVVNFPYAYTYLTEDVAGTAYGPTPTVTGYNFVEQRGAGSPIDLTWYYPSIPHYNDTTAADQLGNMPCVADLSAPGVTSAQVTFRAWIEGTDEECDNIAIGALFNMNIVLYGLRHPAV